MQSCDRELATKFPFRGHCVQGIYGTLPFSHKRSLAHELSNQDTKVSGYNYKVSGYDYEVSGYDYKVSGYDYKVSGYDYRVSGYDNVNTGYDKNLVTP
jgi:hypothetical protein